MLRQPPGSADHAGQQHRGKDDQVHRAGRGMPRELVWVTRDRDELQHSEQDVPNGGRPCPGRDTEQRTRAPAATPLRGRNRRPSPCLHTTTLCTGRARALGGAGTTRRCHGESAGNSVGGMVCAHRPGGPPGSLAGDRINPLLALVHDGVVHLDAHDATDAHVRSRRAERSGIGPLAARQVEPNAAAGADRCRHAHIAQTRTRSQPRPETPAETREHHVGVDHQQHARRCAPDCL